MTLHRYVWLYNQELPQSVLASKTPVQAMKDWYKIKPELFKKKPYYLPGCDTYVQSPECKKGIVGCSGIEILRFNAIEAGKGELQL
ncbi:putative transposase, IS481 family [Serratia symbiotica str. Tucson]|uniref:Putative transposase, IS481 family n=1 Tax=Serratia symbiotica str. Tucson TaxID=914128 RepID=E9CMJ3_9GAMM|nr:putative transposase, IS481 family [Serratia symbiotica str. Tucson]